MVICSYVLIAAPGESGALGRQIGALPGCEVACARNRDVLLIVTEAEDAAGEAALRDRIANLEGVRTLALTFGRVESGNPQLLPSP